MTVCKNILQMQKVELKLLKSPNMLGGKKPYNYKKWFIENSDHFTKVDAELSKNVSEKVDAEIKSCYKNCWHGISRFPNEFDYYEGIVWSKDLPIPLEHSWLVKDNLVIDPTLIINGKTFQKQIKKYELGEYPKKDRKDRLGQEYMGVKIPNDFVMKTSIKKKVFGEFLLDYYLEDTH